MTQEAVQNSDGVSTEYKFISDCAHCPPYLVTDELIRIIEGNSEDSKVKTQSVRFNRYLIALRHRVHQLSGYDLANPNLNADPLATAVRIDEIDTNIGIIYTMPNHREQVDNLVKFLIFKFNNMVTLSYDREGMRIGSSSVQDFESVLRCVCKKGWAQIDGLPELPNELEYHTLGDVSIQGLLSPEGIDYHDHIENNHGSDDDSCDYESCYYWN